MCIAILTTAHPTYPFILISNRDEYLARPTHVASHWPPPHTHILGGWDLERSPPGTWLGVTTQGKICCLTNYHEADAAVRPGAKSRGIIVNSWLQGEGGDEGPEEFATRLVGEEEFQGVAGFTLTYGSLQDVVGRKSGDTGSDGQRMGRGLSILSNRAKKGAAIPRVVTGPGQTVAVSNAPFGDRSWAKIRDGEALLDAAVRESIAQHEARDALIHRLLGVLHTDTMPEWDGKEPWKQYCRRMEGSIFVRKLCLRGPSAPADAEAVRVPSGTDSPARVSMDGRRPNGVSGVDVMNRLKQNGYDAQSGSQLNGSARGGYGTQKQTVILVDTAGRLAYFERTLYDSDERPVDEGKGDRQFEFQIENW